MEQKPPFETSDLSAEANDSEGNPRKAVLMPDGTTFYGSKSEYMEAIKEYWENTDKE